MRSPSFMFERIPATKRNTAVLRDLGDAQWARAHGALIDFLHADLDLAFTWLRTAAIDVRDDPKNCELALAKIRAALDAIRGLEGDALIAI
jgi:hypothetical protein